MSSSTTKSRLRQRQYQRIKTRRKRTRRRAALFFCALIMLCLTVIGIKSGLEMSRSIKYPVEYSGYITKYARENDLDPYLVISVIKQESNFVPDARSPYAGGLMQLTEETAHEYAAKMGLENYDYMEPETNIQIGCYVLRCLIDKYEIVDTALAAYNAGMGNVDKWLADPEYSSDGETLDHIPFPETRHYVSKINNYMIEYKENVSLLSDGSMQ